MEMTPLEWERSKRGAVKTGNPRAQLYAAKSRARIDFPPIPKNCTATIKMKNGGSYSYKYADLAAIIHAVTPGLHANGVDFYQTPSEDLKFVETYLTHESGAEIMVKWPIKPMPQQSLDTAPSFQGAVQATKRYALSAILGISTEENIEGDPRFQRGTDQLTEGFEDGDGIRLPRGAKHKKGMTPKQIAEESARAIEAQIMDDAIKTEVGVNGAWSRNKVFIDKFQSSYPHLYENVLDVLQTRLNAIEDEKQSQQGRTIADEHAAGYAGG